MSAIHCCWTSSRSTSRWRSAIAPWARSSGWCRWVPDPRDLHAVERDARRLAELSLGEDGNRDITSMACVAADARGMAVIEAREAITFAGRRYAEAVANACSLPPIEWHVVDGERLEQGQV